MSLPTMTSAGMATLSTMWRGYLRLMDKYPLRMTSMNTCFLMGTGDIIAQVAVERRTLFNYEGPRTIRFLGAGLCVFGPGMHWWYSHLDKFVKGSRNGAVMKKLAMDQLVFLPIYLGGFIVLMAALRRESRPEIKHKLERDYKPMLITSYGLWPVVQFFNFYLFPTHHRVLIINFVGLIWNTYLAWKSEIRDEE